jgi:hypothetical protein
LDYRWPSFLERLVGYILQFVTRGMGNKLSTIGQSDYESELVRADARANAGPMKLNFHLARDHSQLALLAPNVDGESRKRSPAWSCSSNGSSMFRSVLGCRPMLGIYLAWTFANMIGTPWAMLLTLPLGLLAAAMVSAILANIFDPRYF